MKVINIEGIALNPKIIEELQFLQGSTADFDNSGVNEKLKALQRLNDYLVKTSPMSDNKDASEILFLLQDIMYLKQTLECFKAKCEKGGEA